MKSAFSTLLKVHLINYVNVGVAYVNLPYVDVAVGYNYVNEDNDWKRPYNEAIIQRSLPCLQRSQNIEVFYIVSSCCASL